MIRKRDAISEDARRMIKAAASRAGMTVSEWLNEVILDAAADEGVKNLRNVFEDPAERPRRQNIDFDTIYSRLDEIAARIESLSHGNSGYEPAWEGQRSQIDPVQQRAIFDQLSDLLHIPAPDARPPANGYWRKPAMR